MKRNVLLESHLKALKLPTFLLEYERTGPAVRAGR